MYNKFFKQYLKNPRTVGAILPSSKALARKIMESIDFERATCIVEYGPGTGIFTEELIKNKNMCTTILLIEYNKEFYNLLREKYNNEKNVHIVNDSAENIRYYVKKYDIKKVDYVVSGLPFASLPNKVSQDILRNTKELLGSKGMFMTFQYTKFKKHLIHEYFDNITTKMEFMNIPPAYVFSCDNRQGKYIR